MESYPEQQLDQFKFYVVMLHKMYKDPDSPWLLVSSFVVCHEQ